MPSIEEKNETEDEEMDHDTPESEEEESESGSGSDDDDSSVIDEEECEKRRDECLLDMMELEKQFNLLKEQLYTERLNQVELRLSEARAGTATEYLVPLAELKKSFMIRTQVSGILREYRIQNIKNNHESEELATFQHYDSDKALLYDHVKCDLEDKIRRLEEDRHNVDISSDLWHESQEKEKKRNRKNSMYSNSRRRKPVTVSGPYVVYMLEDNDIIDDWTEIMKALKQTQRQEYVSKHHARYDEGGLHYDGDLYSKGQRIIIDNRHDSPVVAQVTAINENEVWVKRSDGTKSKLFIAQLQKGKYTIRHALT